MNTVRIYAHAKLNLTLDVLGRAGAYHEIDSLVTTVDLADRITLKKRKDGRSTVRMRGLGSEEIEPERNNAYLAACAYAEAFGGGADIVIDKNIPMQAGLGGSSADAAGVLNGLARLYGTGEEGLKELADSLGSDTGYLLSGGFARMRGRGERVEALPNLKTMHFLLLLPSVGVPTGECYQRSDSLPRRAPGTETALAHLLRGELAEAKRCFSNGLFEAAKTIVPEVGEAFEALLALSPEGVSMTGSGSGVFGVFETQELCEWAKSRYDGPCRAIVTKSCL